MKIKYTIEIVVEDNPVPTIGEMQTIIDEGFAATTWTYDVINIAKMQIKEEKKKN